MSWRLLAFRPAHLLDMFLFGTTKGPRAALSHKDYRTPSRADFSDGGWPHFGEIRKAPL